MTPKENKKLVVAKLKWLKAKGFSRLCNVDDIRAVCMHVDKMSDDRPLDGIIEIGSYMGAMLFVLSHYLKPNGTVISVDLGRCLHGKRKGKNHTARLQRMIEFLGERGYDAHLCLGRSDDQLDEVRKLARAKTIDILHVDGGHDYETVKHDFEHYGPMIRAGGAAFLHDVNNDKCTVPKFWRELGEARKGERMHMFGQPDNWPGMGVVEL